MVNTVNDIVEVLEAVWVGKEGRNEVDLVVSGELIDELGLPTIDGGTGPKSAGVSSEGGCEDIAVVPQLVRMVGVASDVVTKGASVLRGRAWHDTVPIELATIGQSE